MSMNIVPLTKRRAEPHVIECIEGLLADAENGDLDQVVIVSSSFDRSVSELMQLGSNPYEMLGMLNVLSSRLSQKLQEGE